MEPAPFATLEIAPTTDLGAIKRAYFAALKLHPPHKDADGFKKVRAAYEALLDPAKRAVSVLQAGLDVEAALAPLRARYGEAMTAARTEASAAPEASMERGEAFVRTYARLPLADALARASAKAPRPISDPPSAPSARDSVRPAR